MINLLDSFWRLLLKSVAFVLLLGGCLTALSGVTARLCSEVEGDFDAIIVLSAGFQGARALDSGTRVRVEAGVGAWLDGRAPKIIMSGGAIQRRSLLIADSMTDFAASLGAPLDAIDQEPMAQSTLQNAQFSLAMLDKNDDVLVVTEAFHQLRAKLSFAWAGRTAATCSPPHGAAKREDGQMRTLVREVLAWPYNIARAATWSTFKGLGLSHLLGDGFLA